MASGPHSGLRFAARGRNAHACNLPVTACAKSPPRPAQALRTRGMIFTLRPGPSCADRIKSRPTCGPVPRLSLSPEVAPAHDDISARFVAHHDDDGLALAGGTVAGAGLSVSRGQDDRAVWRRRSDRYLHARAHGGAAQG